MNSSPPVQFHASYHSLQTSFNFGLHSSNAILPQSDLGSDWGQVETLGQPPPQASLLPLAIPEAVPGNHGAPFEIPCPASAGCPQTPHLLQELLALARKQAAPVGRHRGLHLGLPRCKERGPRGFQAWSGTQAHCCQ